MAFGIKALADDGGHTMKAGYLRVAVALWITALVAGGYAESFSNRPALADMSEYVAQGIICGKAVRERELAVDRGQSFLPYCGVWQPYIASLQQELETLAPMYIDHANGPLTDAGDDFLYFTLDNWRAVAGLNASGFRRSTDGISFSYGQMQSGDIIGPWIFEDLQKAFSALRWTTRDSLGLNGYYKHGIGEDPDVGTAKAIAESDLTFGYADCIPVAISNELPFASHSVIIDSVDVFITELYRRYGTVSVQFSSGLNARSADLYFVATNAGQGHSTYNTFGDFAAPENVLSVVHSFDESTEAEFSFSVGNTTQPPWCGVPPYHEVASKGYIVTQATYLCKWNFTI